MTPQPIQKRPLYAYWRFTVYLLHEFRWSLAIFWTLVFGGGALISTSYHGRELSYLEAVYGVFMLIFMESALQFPQEGFLQPLWFLFPIVGLGAVADSVVRLGYMVFARKEKLQEWHIMHASSLRDHMVVVGAGKVGSRIIKDLIALKELVVAVDKSTDNPLVSEVIDMGVPVIQGDCRMKKTLELAGVERAKAVILVTEDDLSNLDGALTAREIKPDVRVVLRIFDETLATKVASAFKMPAISTSVTSAPAFIAAATGRTVLAGFSLGGTEKLHVADVGVETGSPLAGKDVGAIQSQFCVNIVMHRRGDKTRVNPAHDLLILPGDRMLVLATLDRIPPLDKPVS